jgi:hypothetical protein
VCVVAPRVKGLEAGCRVISRFGVGVEGFGSGTVDGDDNVCDAEISLDIFGRSFLSLCGVFCLSCSPLL